MDGTDSESEIGVDIVDSVNDLDSEDGLGCVDSVDTVDGL